MRLLFISLISLILLYVPNKANAGSLNWTAYSITHYAPYVESSCYNNYSYLSTCNNTNWAYVNSTPVASGTLDSLNYNWNSGSITPGGTNIGSNSRMLVITGWWQHPGTAGQTSTVYFVGRNDDGFIVNINDTQVINDWAQQGPRYWNSSGNFTGVGGQWYPIVINWYEWGGSANMDLHYSLSNLSTNSTSGWLDMPNSGFSTTDQNQVDISITSDQTTIMNTAKGTSGNGVNMTTNGDGITLNIQQAGEDNFIIGTDWSSNATITGNNNTLTVDQGNITTSGTSGRNGIGIDITGNTNNVNISQGDYASDSGDHRIWLDIDGDTNTLNLSQRNDGAATSEHFMYLDIDSGQNVINAQQLNDGDKTLFLDINNDNNTVDINQSDDGSHYLDVLLDTGSYAHDVDISQSGTGNHAARIDLDGYSTDFDLSQSGGTDQDYSITSTCGSSGGCTLSTTQN